MFRSRLTLIRWRFDMTRYWAEPDLTHVKMLFDLARLVNQGGYYFLLMQQPIALQLQLLQVLSSTVK